MQPLTSATNRSQSPAVLPGRGYRSIPVAMDRPMCRPLSSDRRIIYRPVVAVAARRLLDSQCNLSGARGRVYVRTVVLNLFHCWDPLNATDVVWDPQVKIEKVCAPE